MEEKITGFNKKQIIIRTVCAAITAIFLLTLSMRLLGTIRNKSDFNMLEYVNGWNIRSGSEVYEDVSLAEFTFPHTLSKGDEIVLTNKIPKNLENPSTLRILIYLATVDVYIDNEQVYSYGHDIADAGKLVGSGYHFIELPADSAGKEISIVFDVSEDDAFTNVVPFVITPSRYAVIGFANINMPSLFVGIFLFVVGMVLSIVSGCAIYFNRAYDRLFLMGLLGLLVGAWALCNAKLLQLFDVNLAHQTFVEYACLYLATIPLMLLILKMNNEEQVFKKMLLYGALILVVAFNLLAFILQIFNILHFPKTLRVFHIVAVVMILMVIAGSIKKFSLMDNSEKTLHLSVVALCAFGVADIGRFNVSKYLVPDSTFMQNSILPFGMLVFVLLLLVSYFLYVYDMVEDQAKSFALEKLAYNDTLTGLFNRAKFDLLYKELEESKRDYYFINMDLNGLKYVNDTYGHGKGDQLLTQFSGVLRSAFGGIGTIIRMGGDEFLVLVDDINADQIKPALKRMIELEEIRTNQLGFPVECSFGVATNKENESFNPEQVYQLADERMYAMKIKNKKNR